MSREHAPRRGSRPAPAPALPAPPTAAQAIAETRAWVERAVIGLNLCPFAKAVQVRGQARYVASDAVTADGLLAALLDEMQALAAADPDRVDTTLLIHPRVLVDFADFNDFLDVADAALEALDLDGVLQIASFHPDYRFAGSRPRQLDNATNRSPWPTLQLLREASIDRAVAAFPDPAAIYDANRLRLRVLGATGWAALQADCRRDAAMAAGPSGEPNPAGADADAEIATPKPVEPS